jgi:hypothetical protein
MVYVIASFALSVAWVPLLVRFLRGWRSRRNPVSLAICATISALIYGNVTTALTAMGQGAWETVRTLTIAVNAFVVLNFYLSFHWSGQRFPDARRGSYSIPPMNVSKPSDD